MFSGDDVYRPSYFEMIAADRLVPSLRPSFAHLCRVVARRAAFLAPLDSWSSEIFAGVQLALEAHYLQRYDSSFAENFYGLKRMRVLSSPPASSLTPRELSHHIFGAEAIQAAARPPADRSSSGSGLGPGHSAFFRPLSSTDRRRALFFLVVLPYLRGRLEALYIRWRDQVDEDGFQVAYDPSQHSRPYNWLRSAVLRLYPVFHALVEASQFLGGVRFLFESSVFYSPWLGLSSQVARRMNMDEMLAEPPVAAVTTFQPGLVGLLQRLLSAGGDWLTRYAKYGLLGAVCAFKFLEWWYSPANAYYSPSGAAVRKLPIPPPPLPPLPAPGVDLPDDASLCPLCMHERVNPAATPTGYVFCYACIHQHLTAHRSCPVTLKPCTIEQLRKIYEN